MKVLVVDDSPLIRNQMKSFFDKELQYEVVLAKDGEEGVELYKTNKPDLVTLDITMPKKSGLQALKEIMDFDSNARVIMVSALSDNEKITEAMSLGAQGYLAKPLKLKSQEFIEDFKEEIESALE
jgi:two-component system chemotaxis response regulator CheY